MHEMDEQTAKDIISDVREMHNRHSRLFTDEEYDIASGASVGMLTRVGYKSDDDLDEFGCEVGDLDQTLLTILMMRLPKLRDAILNDKLEWVDAD